MTGSPRDNLAEAREILGRLRPDSGIGAGTQMYGNLTQKAIGHALVAIGDTLAAILNRIEPAEIPGLPAGYEITTRQTGNGNRKWRYELAGPRMAYSSRYRYDTSETALTAGIRHARDDAAVPDGLPPLLEAAREGQALNEPVHVVQDDRIDVYGIGNPEVD
jgi:hypothetical protein